MAKFEDGNLSGSFGNFIFYSRDGKTYVRSKPGRRKKKRGQPADPNKTIFGKVSTQGSRMLNILRRQLLFSFSLASYNNTRSWMRNQYAANQQQSQWDISARPNDMCQLNIAADLRDMLFTSVAVMDTGAGKLQVSIPAMNPQRDIKKLPAQTTAVNMKLAVLYTAFEGSSPAYIAMEQYQFNYENTLLPAKDIIIDTEAPAGNLALVVLAIEPVKEGKSFTAEWLPAAIIGMGRVK